MHEERHDSIPENAAHSDPQEVSYLGTDTRSAEYHSYVPSNFLRAAGRSMEVLYRLSFIQILAGT